MGVDEALIICVAWGDDVAVMPGSQIRWCGMCGTEISVSPEGLGLIDRGEAKPVCTDCGLGLADMDEPDEMITRIGGREYPMPGDVGRSILAAYNELRDRG